MRAIAITEFGGRDKLRLMDLPVPVAADGEVLIHIQAAGVNPVDWKIREGMLKDRLPHEFPLILGWDAAGVIAKQGKNANRLSEGDEVFAYCRKPVVKDGTYAEYIALPEDNVALKPKSFSFEEAATVPLAALTAYQALFDAGKLKPDGTVLIQPRPAAWEPSPSSLPRTVAPGPWARRARATVTTCWILAWMSTSTTEPVTSGMRPGRHALTALISCFDCVGGDVLQESADIIKPGGHIVSITDPVGVDKLAKKGITAGFVFVEPIREELERIAEMIDAGRLRTCIAASFRLDEAAAAHEQSEAGHTRGKIVLRI